MGNPQPMVTVAEPVVGVITVVVDNIDNVCSCGYQRWQNELKQEPQINVQPFNGKAGCVLLVSYPLYLARFQPDSRETVLEFVTKLSHKYLVAAPPVKATELPEDDTYVPYIRIRYQLPFIMIGDHEGWGNRDALVGLGRGWQKEQFDHAKRDYIAYTLNYHLNDDDPNAVVVVLQVGAYAWKYHNSEAYDALLAAREKLDKLMERFVDQQYLPH